MAVSIKGFNARSAPAIDTELYVDPKSALSNDGFPFRALIDSWKV